MIKKVQSTSEESTAVTKTSPKTVSELKDFILDFLEDEKAENTETIDLEGKSDIADYMIITTGRSTRHVGSIADNLVKKLKEVNVTGVTLEGMQQCDWVLVDAFDIIVHVFRQEIREFYNLEKMWRVTMPEAKPEVTQETK